MTAAGGVRERLRDAGRRRSVPAVAVAVAVVLLVGWVGSGVLQRQQLRSALADTAAELDSRARTLAVEISHGREEIGTDFRLVARAAAVREALASADATLSAPVVEFLENFREVRALTFLQLYRIDPTTGRVDGDVPVAELGLAPQRRSLAELDAAALAAAVSPAGVVVSVPHENGLTELDPSRWAVTGTALIAGADGRAVGLLIAESANDAASWIPSSWLSASLPITMYLSDAGRCLFVLSLPEPSTAGCSSVELSLLDPAAVAAPMPRTVDGVTIGGPWRALDAADGLRLRRATTLPGGTETLWVDVGWDDIRGIADRRSGEIFYRVAAFAGAALVLVASVGLVGARRRSAAERVLATRFAMANSAGRVGVFDYDLRTGQLEWSDELLRHRGIAAGDFDTTAQSYNRTLHPDDRDATLATIAAARPGVTHELEFRVVRPDGTVRRLAGRFEVEADASGRRTRMFGTEVDVTERWEAEQALAEREERLRQITDSADEVFWLTDAETGRVLYVSPAYERLWGRKVTDLYGDLKLWARTIHPEDKSEALAAFRAVVDDGVPRTVEFRVVHPDGQVRWVAATASAVRDNGGRIVRLAGNASDITERVERTSQLARAYEFERLLVDNSGAAVFATDTTGVITRFNPAAERLTGYGAVEVIGQATPELFHDRKELEERARQMSEELGRPIAPFPDFFAVSLAGGKVFTSVWTYVRKDGAVVPVEASVVWVRDARGKAVGSVAVVRDISAQRDNEAAQRQQAELLEALVSERTAELSAARDEARHAVATKDEFVATMSHEIRTPLNAVLGVLELVERNGPEALQGDALRLMRGGAEAVLSLVDDVLQFQRLQTGTFELAEKPLDVRDLVASVVSMLTPAAQAKGLALRLVLPDDIPADLLGDPGRLRQVLLNLAANAVKFTPHGEVTLRVGEPARGDEHVDVLIEVTDTGIGIAQADMERIFEPFVQVEMGADRTFEGTGLGLAISRRLVTAMNGTLEARSEPGVGTTMSVRVPLRRGGSEPVGPDAEMSTVPAARVLLVEDNPVNRAVAVAQLEHLGVQVIEAESGSEALDLLAADRFDLAFVDMRMPGMDGLELTRRVRAREQETGDTPTPIVALTANALEEDRRRCLDAGMNGFLTKPLRLADLAAALASHLRTVAAERATGD